MAFGTETSAKDQSPYVQPTASPFNFDYSGRAKTGQEPRLEGYLPKPK